MPVLYTWNVDIKVSDRKSKPSPVKEDDSPSSLDHQVSKNAKHLNDIESGKKKKKKRCNAQLLRRRFPIVVWLPTYNWNLSVFDLIAGITVGLTIIPQSIAYAGVAGLPLEVHTYYECLLIEMRALIAANSLVDITSMVYIPLSWDCLLTPYLDPSKNLLLGQQLSWP